MNKKYIDFVPTKKKSSLSGVKTASLTKATKKTSEKTPSRVAVSRSAGVAQCSAKAMQRSANATRRSAKVTPSRAVKQRGAIYTELPAARKAAPAGDFEFGVVEELTAPKTTAKTTAKATVNAGAAYQIPKSPFINQASVVKRPLSGSSKNVYQKKIKPTQEVSSGPVAIVSKPEKDSKAGVVVGIILTIILGAAAGTVAFLLLPK